MIEATIRFPAVHAFDLPALFDRMREIAFWTQPKPPIRPRNWLGCWPATPL